MPRYKIHFKRGSNAPECSIIANLPENYRTPEDVWNMFEVIEFENASKYLNGATILKRLK